MTAKSFTEAFTRQQRTNEDIRKDLAAWFAAPPARDLDDLAYLNDLSDRLVDDMPSLLDRLEQADRFAVAFQGEADRYHDLLQQISGELHAMWERTNLAGLQQLINQINTTLTGGER